MRSMQRGWSELQVISLHDDTGSRQEQEHTNGYNESRDEDSTGFTSVLLTALSLLLVILTLPFSLIFVVKIVNEYERLVVFRLGRLMRGGPLGPGLVLVLPCIDSAVRVDLRVLAVDVDPQELLSSDSVTVTVDAVVYYCVTQPQRALTNVEDYSASTRLIASSALRTVLGTRTLAEIVGKREHVAQAMQEALNSATSDWGVQIQRVEIKDVRLPSELQRAMAAEAEASREARAKVIAAEGEQKASEALKRAAENIEKSPSAIQLRYLQSLGSVGDSKLSSTIVLPWPTDFVAELFNQ